MILADWPLQALLVREKESEVQSHEVAYPRAHSQLLLRSNSQTQGSDSQSSSLSSILGCISGAAILNFHAILQIGCWFHSRKLQGKFSLPEGTAGMCAVLSCLELPHTLRLWWFASGFSWKQKAVAQSKQIREFTENPPLDSCVLATSGTNITWYHTWMGAEITH